MRITAYKLHIKAVAIFTAVLTVLLSGAPAIRPSAQTLDVDTKRQVSDYEAGTEHEIFYRDVLNQYEKTGYRDAVSDIKVDIFDAVMCGSPVAGVESSSEYVKWNDEEWLECSVYVPQEGLYNITFAYYIEDDINAIPAVRGVLIDGARPFFEAGNLKFPLYYKDDGDPQINNLGDEIQPDIAVIPGMRQIKAYDIQGLYPEALKFYFSEGKHTIRLEFVSGKLNLSGITLSVPERYATYGDYIKRYSGKLNKKNIHSVTFQAETDTAEKNDSSLNRQTNGDPACDPQSLLTKKLNVIGDYMWRSGGQSITWSFDVPEDGFYQISMRIAQYWNDGLSSYRKIAIDGEVPFKELLSYEFSYNRKWQQVTLSDDEGNTYLFYLEKGHHTLTMSVVLGKLSELVLGIYEDSLELSSIIRKIIMITGNDPDPNYQYFLDEKIPDLLPRLEKLKNSLEKKIKYINSISSKRPSISNDLTLVCEQLEEMIENPDSISQREKDLTDAQGILGNWYQNMQLQPMVIDYFIVHGKDKTVEMRMSNVFDVLYAMFRAFINSYLKDYTTVAGTAQFNEDTKILKVWVSHGRDWAELIKELSDKSFTQRTNTVIKMNILPQPQLNVGSINSLMLSIASNNQPDIALGIERSSPVEFAIRNAVVDLSKFEGFDDVISRFVPGTIVPYQYRGGTYAVPETMDFRVFIYRKDVFSELTLEVPDTWDDVYNYVMPKLYQNNMQFYVPQDFSMFLLQNGGSYYTEDGLKSALDSPQAYIAFKQYTDLFTSYSVPITANFYMRMRSGEIPCGIGGFGDYMQLSVAAPELNGKWSIALVPGIRDSSGDINRSVANIAGNADIILNGSKFEKESWAFLDWWTSAETQTLFGRMIEAKLGERARWNTSNMEAFKALPWKPYDLNIITQCWTYVNEIPVVLGGYMTGRNVVNAWNRVVLGGENPRNSLEEAVEDINRELLAKQEEYNLAPERK